MTRQQPLSTVWTCIHDLETRQACCRTFRAAGKSRHCRHAVQRRPPMRTPAEDIQHLVMANRPNVRLRKAQSGNLLVRQRVVDLIGVATILIVGESGNR